MKIKDRFAILKELWLFLRVRKKFWLAPIIIMLFLLGFLIVFLEGSAVLSSEINRRDRSMVLLKRFVSESRMSPTPDIKATGVILDCRN